MNFLRDYSISPEELRQWALYDVYMIQWTTVAEHINKTIDDENKKFNSSKNKPMPIKIG